MLKWKKIITISTFVIASLCSSMAIAYEADVKPAPLAEIPIQIVNNRVLVEIKLGHYELDMALDTGASSTALFQSTGVTYSDLAVKDNASIIFPALDEIVEGVKLQPLPIQIGSYEYMPGRLIRVDRRPPIGDRLDLRFDGVLGQDFFSTYVVEISKQHGIMRLYEAGVDLSPHFKTNLPLSMTGSAPHVEVRTRLPWEKQSRSKKLMIDTGYPGAMVIWGAKHFQMAARGENPTRLKEENTGIFTQASFKVGPLKFLHTPIFVAPKEPRQTILRDGVIGGNTLIWYNHVIDFPSERLLIDTWRVNFNYLDSALYLPNDEDFIVKQYKAKESIGMKTVIGMDPQ